ncbi:response regulator [Ningiella sp. W23]|uniref:response regulator n=1 Tax=Ningiella sp. W23 TaxID=3023715 RepID=UPI00375667CC
MHAKAKIVLVEDDRRLRTLVTDYLTQHEFDVTALADGNDLLRTVEKTAPQIVILDIMLPGDDGFSLCKSLRRYYNGSILFLTAKNDVIDQVLGLELGADDYILKPVEPRILVARIQALLRRMNQQSDNSVKTLNFGQLSIDKLARTVMLGGESISLTSHEFDLLYILAENAGKVVHKDTIYRQIIGREYDGLDRSADVRISRIRKKLQDNPQHPYRIKTIWGKGFFFVADAWR